MAKTTRYEVFQDDEMIAAFDDLSKYEEVTDPIFENLVNQGYRFLQSSTCGYGGYSIYFNELKMKVTIINYKQATKVFDQNGQQIYREDVLQDEEGYRWLVGITYETNQPYLKMYRKPDGTSVGVPVGQTVYEDDWLTQEVVRKMRLTKVEDE